MASEPDHVGWVHQPDTRGTFDIIQSCLFTIFICCWTIVHPKVAMPGSSTGQRLLDKTVCLLIAAIAPEVIVYIAFWDYLLARDMTVQMAREPRMGSHWSLTHSFFAQMGGFGLASTMGNHDVSKSGWVDARTILNLVADGSLDPAQIPSRGEIRDKGKADALVKMVALVQTLWLLAQCVGRAAQHLPITTIEISTVAFIPCAVIISFCWWSKPMDVNEPIALRLVPLALRRILDDHVARDEDDTSASVTVYEYTTYPLARDAAYAVSSVLGYVNLWGLMTIFFCLLFGGLHCLAWNFHFPTPIERLLWRICSIVIACSIPVSWLFTHAVAFIIQRVFPGAWYDFVQARNYFSPGHVKISLLRPETVLHGLGLLLYVVARLYLMVEVFSSLRSQPKDVYKTVEWTNFWPHG